MRANGRSQTCTLLRKEDRAGAEGEGAGGDVRVRIYKYYAGKGNAENATKKRN